MSVFDCAFVFLVAMLGIALLIMSVLLAMIVVKELFFE